MILLTLLMSIAHAGWNPNDLSFLLPLPRAGEETAMLEARSPLGDGQLLPPALFQDLPPLAIGRNLELQALKVVAVRVDPCFAEGAAPKICQRQIRLVWQPIVPGPSTVDASMHSFHAPNEAQWQLLVQGLTQLRNDFPMGALPLQIHPVLRAQGYRGGYWQRLRGLILSSCTNRNRVRVTEMTINPAGTSWVFTGFNWREGVRSDLLIPGLGKRGQVVFQERKDPRELELKVLPLYDLNWSNFLQDTEKFPMLAERILKDVAVFENPNLSNPGTVDCARCHLLKPLDDWARAHRPQWSWAPPSSPPGKTLMLRAFGYNGDVPVISPRVANEANMTAAHF